MRWVLLWVVLVLAAATVLGFLGRQLWRKARALAAELAELAMATDRLADVSASLAERAEPAETLASTRPDPVPASRRR